MALEKHIRRIDISLVLCSPELAKVVYKAVKPEADVSQFLGSIVQVSLEGGVLTLRFRSQSTATARALINSYIRWIAMIEESIRILEETGFKWSH